MKKAFSVIFFLLICMACYSQSGTIKVAKKPAPKKDTIMPEQRRIVVAAGSNYTFRETGKFGYEAEIYGGFYKNHFMLGLKYTHENEFYGLSAYDKHTNLPAQGYLRSETESDYLKMPIGFATFLNKSFFTYGANGKSNLCFSMALVPEFLLKTKNQHGRLGMSDFNRLNLSGYCSIGFMIPKTEFAINLSYSSDFFNNLKDKNVYDGQGTVIAKHRSKTHLAALTLCYRMESDVKK